MSDVKAMLDKEAELRRKQYLALGCLAVAMVVFIVTIFMPPTFVLRLIKAGAEAAMVGGLADWFAVVALFRHPLGLRIPHTAIIPQSKDRIADNLADFVREKFLNPQVLTELMAVRGPLYAQAPIRVVSANGPHEDTVNAILQHLTQKEPKAQP